MLYGLITFDLEEFDLPLKYSIKIKKKEMLKVSYDGLLNLLSLLKQHKIRSTFFVTTLFAESYPKVLKGLLKDGHEIAFHGYEHKDDYMDWDVRRCYERLKKGKKVIESQIGCEVYGFRAPRLKMTNYDLLKKICMEYDSSLHPSWFYGKNYFKSRHPFNDGVKVIPISTTPILRLPYSWIWFRNLGINYAKFCTRMSLLDLNYINLYFHSWEFINLNKFAIPKIFKKNTGNALIRNLGLYLKYCKKIGLDLITIKKYVDLNDALLK